MTNEEAKRLALQWAMGEVYECANPKTCPHVLHRMSVDDYIAALSKGGTL